MVYTFQHHHVLTALNQHGTHFLTWDDYAKYSPHQHAKSCYKQLATFLGYRHSPIWGFVSYTKKPITNDWIGTFIETCEHGKNNDHVLFQLDVPDEFVTLTSYYDWSDFIFFAEEGNEEMAALSWKNTFLYHDADRIQAVMESIRQEWLVDIYYPNHTFQQ